MNTDNKNGSSPLNNILDIIPTTSFYLRIYTIIVLIYNLIDKSNPDQYSSLIKIIASVSCIATIISVVLKDGLQKKGLIITALIIQLVIFNPFTDIEFDISNDIPVVSLSTIILFAIYSFVLRNGKKKLKERLTFKIGRNEISVLPIRFKYYLFPAITISWQGWFFVFSFIFSLGVDIYTHIFADDLIKKHHEYSYFIAGWIVLFLVIICPSTLLRGIIKTNISSIKTRIIVGILVIFDIIIHVLLNGHTPSITGYIVLYAACVLAFRLLHREEDFYKYYRNKNITLK